MSDKRFVYIAGRYGDHDGYVVIEERINRARAVAAELARAGIPYYSPHLNSAHFEVICPDVGLDFWRKQDGAFLPRAWAMLVILHEASESAGTQAEVAEAKERGIPVYFAPPELPALITAWKEERDG